MPVMPACQVNENGTVESATRRREHAVASCEHVSNLKRPRLGRVRRPEKVVAGAVAANVLFKAVRRVGFRAFRPARRSILVSYEDQANATWFELAPEPSAAHCLPTLCLGKILE